MDGKDFFIKEYKAKAPTGSDKAPWHLSLLYPLQCGT